MKDEVNNCLAWLDDSLLLEEKLGKELEEKGKAKLRDQGNGELKKFSGSECSLLLDFRSEENDAQRDIAREQNI